MNGGSLLRLCGGVNLTDRSAAAGRVLSYLLDSDPDLKRGGRAVGAEWLGGRRPARPLNERNDIHRVLVEVVS